MGMMGKNGSGGLGGFGAPGQRVGRTETAASETRLPIAQCVVASVSSLIIYVLLLLAIWIAGPVLLVVLGYVLLLVIAVYLSPKMRTVETRVVVALLITGMILAWMFYGIDVARLAFNVKHAIRPVLFIAALIPVPSIYLLVWRMSAEIANPNWSAPLNPRDVGNGGVGWPGTKYRDPNVEELYEPEKLVKAIPVFQHNTERMLTLAPTGSSDTDAKVAIETDSGHKIPLSDISRFIELAPKEHIGPTYRAWKAHWSHEHWMEVVGWLAQYGIVSVPKERSKTAMLVTTEEARIKLADVFKEAGQ